MNRKLIPSALVFVGVLGAVALPQAGPGTVMAGPEQSVVIVVTPEADTFVAAAIDVPFGTRNTIDAGYRAEADYAAFVRFRLPMERLGTGATIVSATLRLYRWIPCDVDRAPAPSYEVRTITQNFRLRSLGVPTASVLPHNLDIFEDEFRKAEGFFTVFATFGGVHLLRVHEVPHIRTVLRAVDTLSVR